MMRGRSSVAVAVREPSGNVATECKRAPDVKKSVWYRIPVVRGVLNFIASLVLGFKTLMRSAEAAGEDDEQIGKGGMAFAVILAIVIFVGLFIFLPRLIASGLERWLYPNDKNAMLWTNIIESVIRIVIFVLYLWAVSLMKDIRRTFMYHGAEHKTINAHEKGGELTVESVRNFSTRHNRCGTTFLFFVIIISILVFTLVTWGLSKLGVGRDAFKSRFVYNLVLMGVRLALLPFVAGLSYELLRLLAKGSDRNIILRILRAPGLALQRLTTKEPDDAMLEVAIASLKAAQGMDADPSMKDYTFELTVDFQKFYGDKKKELEAAKADEAALDWVCCDILNIGRAEIPALKFIKRADGEKISAAVDKLKTGRPLQYIQGYAEFYGYRFAVDKSVLIPRPETEILVSETIKHLNSTLHTPHSALKLLDLCCGSGCIGLSIALKTGCAVTLADVSADALKTAEKNSERMMHGTQLYDKHPVASRHPSNLEGNVSAEESGYSPLNERGARQGGVFINSQFIQSNMFENITGEYDVITCNPPYIKTADIQTLSKTVKDYEPLIALDGGEDGLDFYRVFRDNFSRFLKPGGAAFLEIGAGQAEDVKNLFKEFYTETINDYNGIERVIIIRHAGKVS